MLGVAHEPEPIVARWLIAAAAMGAAITLGSGLPVAGDRGRRPAAHTACWRSAAIRSPTYELKVRRRRRSRQRLAKPGGDSGRQPPEDDGICRKHGLHG